MIIRRNNAAAALTETRVMYMGGAHHDVGSLSRKRYTQCVGQQPKDNGETQLTQGTPEGTYTDEGGREGSAIAH